MNKEVCKQLLIYHRVLRWKKLCYQRNMEKIYITTFETGLSAFFMVKSVAADVSLCESMMHS